MPSARAGHGSPIQLKIDPGSSAVSISVSKTGAEAETGPGTPLPEEARRKIEGVFGADFSGVRVHVGPEPARIGALAYTRGTHIHFAPGRYDPSNRQGQQLLGHELAHVMQQRAGKVGATSGLEAPVNTDPGMEAQADLLGERLAEAPSRRWQDSRIPARAGGSASTSPLRPATPIALPVIQGKFTTSAKLARDGTITAVKISGRPDGQFSGGRQGNHTTSFAVLRDVLESAALGRTPDQAYKKVMDLYDDLSELPGYKGKTVPDPPAPSNPKKPSQADLQALMHHYVECRDRADYSQADLGPLEAITHGENSALRFLRERENEGSLAKGDRAEALKSMQKLFDDTAAQATGKPGRAEDQHWMTMSQAYPVTYNALEAKGLVPTQKGLSQPTPAGGARRDTAKGIYQTLGVSVMPNASGTGIGKIDFSGRTAGPFRGSTGMGHHTIPHSLVEESIQSRLTRDDNVKENLLEIMRGTRDAPIARQEFVDELDPSAAEKFGIARKELRKAKKRIKQTEDGQIPPVNDIESAIEATMLFHNVSPLSAMAKGSVPGYNNEGRALAMTRAYEKSGDPTIPNAVGDKGAKGKPTTKKKPATKGKPTTKKKTATKGTPAAKGKQAARPERTPLERLGSFHDHVWNDLLDKNAVEAVFEADDDAYSYPGLGENPTQEHKEKATAAIMDTFQYYYSATAPTAHEELGIGHFDPDNADDPGDVFAYLTKKLALEEDVAFNITDRMENLVAYGGDPRETRYSGGSSEPLTGKKRRKRKDDDEDDFVLDEDAEPTTKKRKLKRGGR